MNLYAIIANWIGWPIVVAIILSLGGYFYYVSLKHIELLKEENKYLEIQKNDLREISPDIVAQRLRDRLLRTNEEIQILYADYDANKELIIEKKAELVVTKNKIENLNNELKNAQTIINLVTFKALICKYCGAPLEAREYREDTVEYQGREIDVQHERILYECGLELIDEEEVSKCKHSNG